MPKISILPQGRSVAPIHVKFGTSGRHVGQLGRAKFHFSRCEGSYRPPKCQNFPIFDEPVDRFPQYLGSFKRPTTLHECLEFDMVHFTDYRVIEKTTRRLFTPNFSGHPVGKKYALDQKMIPTF